MQPTIRYVLSFLVFFAVAYGQASPKTNPAASSAPKTPTLTNADIIALKQAGFDDDLIILKIKHSGGDYKLQADDLVALKKAGLSGNVMAFMIQASAGIDFAAQSPSSPPKLLSKGEALGQLQPELQEGKGLSAQTEFDELVNLPVKNRPSMDLLYSIPIDKTFGLYGIAPTPFDVAPNRIYAIEPIYTQEAFAAHLEGKVVLSVTIGTNGIPVNIAVQESLGGGLDEEAAAALSRCRFTPGYKDGRPIPVNAVLSYRFNIIPPAQPKHPKLEKALNIAGRLYLAFVCPQVRRIPVSLLNTNEAQTLQMCIENGF